MTDESVTVAAALYIVKLVDRVQRVADPADARELASRVADAVEHASAVSCGNLSKSVRSI
jgi:hypothetical protein